MRNKTKKLILKILENGKEMEAGAMRRELENIDYIINYDTTCRNLKLMFETGLLNRYARGKEINKQSGRRHWNFYYSLNN